MFILVAFHCTVVVIVAVVIGSGNCASGNW